MARHAALALRIDAGTGVPAWQEEPLDLGWAIDVLHPACRGRPPEGPPPRPDET